MTTMGSIILSKSDIIFKLMRLKSCPEILTDFLTSDPYKLPYLDVYLKIQYGWHL